MKANCSTGRSSTDRVRPRRKAVLHSFSLGVASLLVSTSCGRFAPEEQGEQRELLVELKDAVRCGVERWAVKVGTDDDAWAVDLTPLDTTVDTLINFPLPESLPPRNRLPEELVVYRLSDVTLTVYRRETDSDYHLVIDDGGETMIVEIPHPDCVGPDSPFLSGAQTARDAFDSTFTATDRFQTANVTTTVIGAGFFDFLHGQRGVAPNGFELHSVLGICFDPGCDAGSALRLTAAH